ncbi:Protein kinase-like domain [Pseudocohnilembus persalinus]|uniref:Protein kinase-like domain n=1 Tax=Pseudocohnilembus persalinus TaxID=266149 RepID=A0A0V0QL00_PSEPJ|nr:Protein kinase-like domain [Pseudocohnilembus persalinus]|eukprot:KRX02629.1 Protein kinase-like domain [Pseudocohnilembus persalinus]
MVELIASCRIDGTFIFEANDSKDKQENSYVRLASHNSDDTTILSKSQEQKTHLQENQDNQKQQKITNKQSQLTEQQKQQQKVLKQAYKQIENINKGDDIDNNFDKYYKFESLIGTGAFGIVIKAFHKNLKQFVAIKILNSMQANKKNADYLLEEAEILQQLDHPNIVKFIECKKTLKRIFLVMELVDGGTLLKLEGKNFSDKEASIIMKNIIEGVQYCHDQNIIHRDLKPENILVGKKYLKCIKIADFGLSIKYQPSIQGNFLKDWCGTLTYMAPEFFDQQIYNKSVDVWSLSIIMYKILSNGCHPLFIPKVDTPFTYKLKMREPQVDFPDNCSQCQAIPGQLEKKMAKFHYVIQIQIKQQIK